MEAPMSMHHVPDNARLDRIVAEARRNAEQRDKGYRERALKMYPWVCGRCAREFSRANLQELTVHHRNHDHDDNPPDGSNWELLCVYCHDNEHSRYIDHTGVSATAAEDTPAPATGNPFAQLKGLLKRDS
jgi:5-methylcytosine-specific restriction endonuclease McrA